MPLCKCATELEWTQEMQTLEHHPDCSAVRDVAGRPVLKFEWRSPTPADMKQMVIGADHAEEGSDSHLSQPPDPFDSDEGLLAACEAAVVESWCDFAIHPVIGDRSPGPTGEPYVTLSIGGPVPEGNIAALVGTSAKTAREGFFRYFQGWIGDELRKHFESTFTGPLNPVLYWREKPALVIESLERDRGGKPVTVNRYFVWARCLISIKPILNNSEPSSFASQ